jgi:hypothetical protein
MKNNKIKTEIINFYNEGFTAAEICKKTGYNYSLVNVHISKYRRKSVKNDLLFNVNQYDCWVSPAVL